MIRVPVDIKKIKKIVDFAIIPEYIKQTDIEVHNFKNKYQLDYIEAYETMNVLLHLDNTGILVANPYITKKKESR